MATPCVVVGQICHHGTLLVGLLAPRVHSAPFGVSSQ